MLFPVVKYELSLFDRMLSDDLFSDIKTSFYIPVYLDFLQQRFNNGCFKFYVFLYLKKSQNEYILKNHAEYDFLDLRQFSYLEGVKIENEKFLLDHLVNQSLLYINVTKSQIIEAVYNIEKKKTQLFIAARFDYETLSSNEIAFHYHRTILTDEVARIKQAVRNQVFNFRSPKEIALYIQNNQVAIINLCDTVFTFFADETNSDIFEISGNHKVMDIYRLIYVSLEDLLIFIENNYTKYLDSDVPVIYRHRITESFKITEKLMFVLGLFQSGVISTDLTNTILKPLERLKILRQDNTITYKSLIYKKHLLNECYNEFNNSELSEPRLVTVLINSNFNCIAFFNYVTAKILSDVNTEEYLNSKIEKLSGYLKNYLQFLPHTQLTYISSLPPLHIQLIKWIEEEIVFLEKKKAFDTSLQISIPLPNPDNKAKIELSISVAQFSFFCKMLIETDVIINKNQSEVFRTIAENYSTPKVQNMSPSSFSSKFYTVETSTKDAVRDLVIRLLNNINKS